MSRLCGIVIFSVGLVTSGFAIVLEQDGQWSAIAGLRGLPSDQFSSFRFREDMTPGTVGSDFGAGYNMYLRSPIVGIYRWVYDGNGTLRLQQQINGWSFVATYYAEVVDQALYDANYIPPPVDPTETSYEYEFGPEYAGMKVEIVDQFGNVLDLAIVPEEGVTLAGQHAGVDGEPLEYQALFYRPNIEGAYVFTAAVEVGSDFVDGSSSTGASSGELVWTESGEDAPAGQTYTEGGNTYVSEGGGSWTVTGTDNLEQRTVTFNLSNIYGGGQWSIVNDSGGLIATGVAPSGGGSISTVINTLPGEGSSVLVQPLTVGVEGTPILGTPVSVGSVFDIPDSGEVTVVPVPSPTPTPAPPVPDAPSLPATVEDGTVGTDTNTETVELPEDEELPDVDDGEEGVLAQAQSISDKWAAINEGLSSLQGSLQGLDEMFDQGMFDAGSPGKQCTIAMGPASIDLSPYSQYRAATAAFAWGLGAMVVYSITMSVVRK